MIELKPMKEKEYQQYYHKLVNRYINELLKSGASDKSNVKEMAKATIERSLSNGYKTKGQYLLNIYKDNKVIGYIWYGDRVGKEREAFIYDLVICEDYRNKGYGKKTIQLVEKQAKENKYDTISLHVFGDNEVAIKLYNSLDYKPFSIHMSKKL